MTPQKLLGRSPSPWFSTRGSPATASSMFFLQCEKKGGVRHFSRQTGQHSAIPLAVWKCRAACAGAHLNRNRAPWSAPARQGYQEPSVSSKRGFSACLTRHELLKQTHWFAGSRQRVGVSDRCAERNWRIVLRVRPPTHAAQAAQSQAVSRAQTRRASVAAKS